MEWDWGIQAAPAGTDAGTWDDPTRQIIAAEHAWEQAYRLIDATTARAAARQASEAPLAALLYAASALGNNKGVSWVVAAAHNMSPREPRQRQPAWLTAADIVRNRPMLRDALLRTVFEMAGPQQDAIAATINEALHPWALGVPPGGLRTKVAPARRRIRSWPVLVGTIIRRTRGILPAGVAHGGRNCCLAHRHGPPGRELAIDAAASPPSDVTLRGPLADKTADRWLDGLLLDEPPSTTDSFATAVDTTARDTVHRPAGQCPPASFTAPLAWPEAEEGSGPQGLGKPPPRTDSGDDDDPAGTPGNAASDQGWFADLLSDSATRPVELDAAPPVAKNRTRKRGTE